MINLRLIAFKVKVFVYIILVCVCTVYIYDVCIYIYIYIYIYIKKHTYSIYFENMYMYFVMKQVPRLASREGKRECESVKVPKTMAHSHSTFVQGVIYLQCQ